MIKISHGGVERLCSHKGPGECIEARLDVFAGVAAAGTSPLMVFKNDSRNVTSQRKIDFDSMKNHAGQ